MLHELTGDLLLSQADLLAHGIAPNDDFKQGLALALRAACPAMYRDFRHYCRQQAPKPGSLWLWRGVDQTGRPVRLAALFTQEPPDHDGGRPGRARTEHVNHALHELRRLVERERIGSVALPRLATGVGGLDWAHVAPLVQAQLGGLAVPVFVYTRYQKGVAADEAAAARGRAHHA
ncbi:MAG: macro domain-containing protein [Planctomycetes bacterium]|nr:macro domain-containing protein [Planctomycetota bacterium]